MKKVIATAFSLTLILALLAGCGDNGSGQPVPSPSPSASTAATVSAQPTATPEADQQTPASGQQSQENTRQTAKPNPTEKAPSGNSGGSQANGSNSSSGSKGDSQVSSKPQQPAQPEQPQTPTVPPVVPVSTVMANMVSAMDSSTHNLVEMPSNLYAGVYQIDPAQFEEVLIYGAMINVSANEIIVIKAKDQNNLNQAVSALQNRKASQAKQYQNYLADQYELIQRGTVTTNGLYATLVIANQSSRALSAFQSAI